MIRKQTTTKTYILGTTIVAVLALATYNMRDVLFGTHFSINTANDGASVQSLVLPITGNALHAKSIVLNGRPITIDPNGAFTDEVILSPGYNVVEISLMDRFDKETRRTLHVIANDQSALARSNTTITNNN